MAGRTPSKKEKKVGFHIKSFATKSGERDSKKKYIKPIITSPSPPRISPQPRSTHTRRRIPTPPKSNPPPYPPLTSILKQKSYSSPLQDSYVYKNTDPYSIFNLDRNQGGRFWVSPQPEKYETTDTLVELNYSEKNGLTQKVFGRSAVGERVRREQQQNRLKLKSKASIIKDIITNNEILFNKHYRDYLIKKKGKKIKGGGFTIRRKRNYYTKTRRIGNNKSRKNKNNKSRKT